MVRHYYTRKDTMTSFTYNVACEHSLIIMQNMPYGLFSMQHGSFELSNSQTRVLHNEKAAFTHCILSKWRRCILSGVIMADH